jgi:hypothetical protein
VKAGRRRRSEQQQLARSCVLLISSRNCPNFSAKPALPEPCSTRSAASRHHIVKRSDHDHQPAELLAIMGGGGKIPYALCSNASCGADLTPTGTPSTSGRRPEVGMRSPPTGKQTPPSWASS